MQLPYSEELNIGYLSKLFENTTNCYKFFWFQAILRKMDGVRSRFTFDELINEMIADAWYMVTEYHLRLGPLGITDNLEEVVKYIHEKYGFAPAEKREKRLNHKFCGISDSSRSSVGSYRIASERNIRHQDIRIPVCEES